MARRNNSLMVQFELGEYAPVLEYSESYAWQKLKLPDQMAVIGALAFRGEMLEATFYFDQVTSVHPPEATAPALFFLGVGWCRQSQYEKARSHFAKLLRLSSRRKGHAQLRFFAHQGVGLLRFFHNRFPLAHRHAEEAYLAAKSADYSYGQMLALDLMAYTLLNKGDVQRGIGQLEKAERFARKHGFSAIGTAISFALLKSRAQFGLSPTTIVADLENALNHLAANDTYSRSELLIESAKQFLLRGALVAGRKKLEEALPQIYQAGNRRQTARANLLLAHFLLQAGEALQALALVTAASQSITPDQEPLLHSQWLSMKWRCQQALGQPPPTDSELQQLATLARKMGHRTNQQMLHFHWGMALTPAPAGEDPLGELRLRLKEPSPTALREALDAGYYGLIAESLQLPLSQAALIWDLSPGSLLVVTPNGSHFHTEVPPTPRRVLEQLELGVASKETLVETVWGYRYDPLRHDTLIYTTMNRVKAFVGENIRIEAVGRGYQLNSAVRTFHMGKPKGEREQTLAPKSDVRRAPNLSLNYRQQIGLQWLNLNPGSSASQYGQSQSVTRMTAFRDLNFLVELGYAEKRGRGKATRYAALTLA